MYLYYVLMFVFAYRIYRYYCYYLYLFTARYRLVPGVPPAKEFPHGPGHLPPGLMGIIQMYLYTNNKRPLTPKIMPSTGDNHHRSLLCVYEFLKVFITWQSNFDTPPSKLASL